MPIQSPTSPLVAQSSEEGIRDHLISYPKRDSYLCTLHESVPTLFKQKMFFAFVCELQTKRHWKLNLPEMLGLGSNWFVAGKPKPLSLPSSVGHPLVLKFLFDSEEGTLRESAIRHNENHHGFPGICKKMSSSHKSPQINQKCACNIHVKISRESYIN